MKRYTLLLIALMGCCMAMMAQANEKKRILELKQDTTYMWGQKVDPVLDEAFKLAITDMLQSINIMRKDQGMSELSGLPEGTDIQTIDYKRGDAYVVFVCAPKAALMSTQAVVAAAEPAAPVAPARPDPSRSEADILASLGMQFSDILAHVCAPEMATDIARYLTRIHREGRISQLDKTTNYGSIPADAYVVAFDREYVVQGIMTPASNGVRTDIKNDRYVSQPMTGVGYIWFK